MHSIRLRGPWELEFPSCNGSRRVEMPATWQTLLALATEAGSPSARLVRRFGIPTGIAEDDRLQLVVESAEADYQVELNGQVLGSVTALEPIRSFDVTSLLKHRNELAVLLRLPPRLESLIESNRPAMDARLEIISPD